jgi:hypothetical protein
VAHIRDTGEGLTGPTGEDQHILVWFKEVPCQTVNVSVRNAGFYGVAPPSDEHLSGVE